MRLLFRLVAKDLKRKIRAPLSLVITLSFPILFAGMIALAFGSKGDAIPKVRILIANEDGGFLANGLAAAFISEQAGRIFDAKQVQGAEGRKLMADGKASALLTIPKNFGDDLIDGKPVELALMRNPAEGVLPEIAEQTTGTLAELLDAARRVFDKPIAELRPLLRASDDRAPSDSEIIAISLAVKRVLDESGRSLFPPAIALDSELFESGTTADASAKAPKTSVASTIFLMILPGVAVYALFLVGDQAMRDVMTERTLGTLRRQLAGPVTVPSFLAAKAIYTAALSLLALVVLAAVGGVALRARVSVGGFVALSLVLVVAITGTSAAIYGLAKTERQGSTLSSIVYLAMAMLGGSFVRIESLPPSLRAVAPYTPFYWGTDGYRRLLETGGGFIDILEHVAVLAAIGFILLGVGMLALRRTVRTGTAA